MTGEQKLITFRDVLYVFFKNKALISLVFSVAVVGTIIYCLIAPSQYRAETKVLVRAGKAQTSGVENYPERPNIVFQERTQNIRNEMELLKGEYLSEKVAERIKDKILLEGSQKSIIRRTKDEIKALIYRLGWKKQVFSERRMGITLMNHLTINYLEDTDMIRISFDWPDPKIAAMVANAYADEYINQHMSLYDSQRSYRFYVDQIELSEKKLKDAENELQEFTMNGSLANIELQKDILLRNIGDLTTKYNQASIDYAQALMKTKQIKEMIAKPGTWVETPEGPAGTAGSQTDKQGYLRTLDDAYFKLKVERERMLKNYTPISSEVKAIDLQLGNLKKQKGDSLLNISSIELGLAANKRDSLQQEINIENKKLTDINAKTIALKQLQRQKETIETNYQLYKKKAEEFRVSDDLDTKRISSVKIVSPALPPLEPAYPKKAMTIMMAAFIGLFFGFGFSAVREFFNHTFKDEGNVQSKLDIPFLMTISFYGEKKKQDIFSNPLKVYNRIRAKYAKKYRKIALVTDHLNMQNVNGVLLILLSLTTFAASGYFIYDRHRIDRAEELALMDRKLPEEKYLAQSPMTFVAEVEKNMKPRSIFDPLVKKENDKSQNVVSQSSEKTIKPKEKLW